MIHSGFLVIHGFDIARRGGLLRNIIVFPYVVVPRQDRLQQFLFDVEPMHAGARPGERYSLSDAPASLQHFVCAADLSRFSLRLSDRDSIGVPGGQLVRVILVHETPIRLFDLGIGR